MLTFRYIKTISTLSYPQINTVKTLKALFLDNISAPSTLEVFYDNVLY